MTDVVELRKEEGVERDENPRTEVSSATAARSATRSAKRRRGVRLPVYSRSEETANAVTHGLAALLSIAGLVVMVVEAVLTGKSAVVVASSALFGATMVILYLVSTLYHAIPNRRAKRILQIFDHSAIYLLIAGSYTPFCLITLGGVTGWALFFVVWGIALAGVIFQPFLMKAADWINCLLYLGLGWCVIFVVKPLVEALPWDGLALLAGGGVAYSAGVVFYLWDKLPFNHAIWHVFVLAGTALQFFAVLFYVIPSPIGV